MSSAVSRRLPDPAPWERATREQLALIGLGRRRELVLILLCGGFLGLMGVLPVKIPVVHVSPGPDGVKTVEFNWWPMAEMPFFANPQLWPLLLSYQVLLFLGLLWPLSIWQDLSPPEREMFWSQPIGRCPHELARVAAGSLWLIGACAVLLSLAALGLAAGGDAAALTALATSSWTHYFTGPLTLYLLASTAALRSRRPGRAIVAAILALFVPFAIFATVEFQAGYDLWHAVIGGDLSYAVAMGGPVEDILGVRMTGDGRWTGIWATGLWLALGLAAVAAAAYRRHN